MTPARPARLYVFVNNERRIISVILVTFSMGLSACGGEIGAEDVTAINAYLSRAGYFPNDELAERYPRWVPAVPEGPAAPDVFDERSMEALELFQAAHGLEVTGLPDEATRSIMAQPRCGNPDHVSGSADDKWHHDAEWSDPYPYGGTFTYRVEGQATGLGRTLTLLLINEAFDMWHQEIGVRFVRVDSTQPSDAVIEFVQLDVPGMNTILGRVMGTAFGPRFHMQIDTNDTYSYPADNFVNLVVHELGHLLGFNHSGINGAVMWPTLSAIDPIIPLTDDDLGATASRYRRWVSQPGLARDIGAGPSGTWVIGTIAGGGGHSIHRWHGSGWTRTSGLAERIAVGDEPWVVNASGRIYKRLGVTAGNPLGTSWRDESRTTRAIDIGVGTGDTAWVIGTQSRGVGGNAILRFTGTGWTEVGGAARRVSVSGEGDNTVVFVVNAQGRVYRRVGITAANPSGTSWQQLTNLAPNDFGNETGFATDVGVARDGVAWATGTADGVPMTFLRQEQPIAMTATGVPVGVSTAFNRWVPIPGNATSIDAHVVNAPWIVDASTRISNRLPE